MLVIARDRLRTLVAQLDAIGRSPRRVLAEVQTAPAGNDAWHVSLSASGAVLRVAPTSGIALDRDILGPLLTQHAANARTANQAPSHIEIHAEPGTALPDLDALATETGIPLRTGSPYAWWRGADRQASSLRHGEFGSRDRNSAWMDRLGPALALGGGALALWLIAGVGEVLWLRHSLDGIGQRMARVYQTSFPNTPVVSPAAQMRQQLNLERARHGLLRDDDALALLAQASDALGTDAGDSVAALHFEEGRLDLTLTGPALDRADALAGLLASRGLLADLRRDGNAVHLVLRRETLQ